MAKSSFDTYIDGLHLASTSINVDNLTNGSVMTKQYEDMPRLEWNGSGIFDKLMYAINENLRTQHDTGRLIGPDYAQAYIQLVPVVLDKATELLTAIANLQLQAKASEADLKLKAKDAEIKEEQKKLTKLQQEKLRSEIKVLDRQKQGFDENVQLKLLQAQLEAFGAIFSSGLLNFDENSNSFPKALKPSALTEVYDTLFASSKADWSNKHTVEKRIKKAGEESGIEL